MTVGDPKKAMLLAFTALAMVAFVIVRVLPQGKSAPTVALQRPASGPSAFVKKPSLSLIVVSDAFWHKKLKVKKVDPESEDAKNVAKPQGGPKISTGEVAAFSDFNTLPDAEGTAPAKLDPDGNTSSDQQLIVNPKLKLVGVMAGGNKVTAIIEIAGNMKTVMEGSQLNDLKVTNIESSRIRVAWGKRSLWISVGEEAELK